MNIIEQEDIIKGLPDDALQREARMPSGQVPQFLVVSEIQRRTDMRKRFEANQPQQNMSVAEQVVQEGIGAVQPTMMAEGGRTPFTAKYANGGISGIGLPQIGSNFVRNMTLDPYGNPVNIDPSTDAEFIRRNRGYDVGPLGIPIYEATRDNERSANIRDLISRDQTTRFDLPSDAYATGRAETPIDRGINTLQNIDIDLSNPLSRAITDVNKNAPTSFDESVLGRGTSRALDFLGDLSLPQFQYDKFPFTGPPVEGEKFLSNIVGAGSLEYGGSDDQLTPMGQMTFASDTPSDAQKLLDIERKNEQATLAAFEKTPGYQDFLRRQSLPDRYSGFRTEDQILSEEEQEAMFAKQQAQFQKDPEIVDDPVKRAAQTLDDIGANTDTTVVTGATVADAAKTDPVSIAAKQYADLLGGEKNDKMRNALMLASLGAGIAKGDTAGGLQQAANVAASYQQKEIDRAEKDLDRAIKREDAASDKAIAMQRLNQTTEYYAGKRVSDALALEQTRERIQATQRQTEQSANNNALSFLTSSLDQQLKANVGYRTMSPEEKYSTIKSILDGQAAILKEFGHGASNNLDGMVERIARQRSGLSSNPAPTGEIAARYDSATGMRQ
jgi:hypothetical protein